MPSKAFQLTLLSALLRIATGWGSPSLPADGFLAFEAELPNDLTFPWEIIEARDSSGGLALTVPEGSGSQESFGETDPGIATYRFSLDAEEKGFLWLRVRWNGTCSNSVNVEVNGASPGVVHNRVFGRWQWLPAGPFTLRQGSNEIRLRNREDGIWVDQVLFRPGPGDPADGPLRTNVVPGGAPSGAPAGSEPLRFFVSASFQSIQALPPVDFLVLHEPTEIIPLLRFPLVVLRERSEALLRVWLRNNGLGETEGKVSLRVTDDRLKLEPAIEQTFQLSAGEPLKRMDFKLGPGGEVARALQPMYLRVQQADGKVQGKKILLLRPFQWLVTPAYPCPISSGMETPTSLEARAGKGFPGRAGEAEWSLASEDAVTPFGMLDMRKAVSDQTFVMAYAYTRLEAEEGGDYLLDVRHDDMVRVWVNGEAVFTSLRSAPSAHTRQLVKVKFLRGSNDLLVKICQLKNYWEFGLQVLTPDLRPAPVRGVDVSHLLKLSDSP